MAELQEPQQTQGINEFLQLHPELRQEIETGAYDNEWVKFMSELSKNNSVQDLVNHINSCHWSRRQKKTLMVYCRTILANRFSTTNFKNMYAVRTFTDNKSIVDCTLDLGLTRFDLTPEWNTLLGLINLHFEAIVNMSKEGWFTERIGTQRHEIYQEEKTRERNLGYREKINNIIGD